MTVRTYSATVTTDGSGNATAYVPIRSGYIESIQYVKNNYTDGVDFTITAEATGENIWTQTNVNASVTVRPRTATHTTAGVAATYDGTRATLDRIALGGDRVKIVLAQGGASHSGTFKITTDDPR